MPRTCTICAHRRRKAIERALLAGQPFRKLAARFDTSTGALQRHKSEHLSTALLKADRAEQATRGDDLLKKIENLEVDARRIAAKAEKGQDLRTAIVAIRELTRIVELLAKLRGELQQPQQVINVQVLAPVILDALVGFPEARVAVAARLQELDGSNTLA